MKREMSREREVTREREVKRERERLRDQQIEIESRGGAWDHGSLPSLRGRCYLGWGHWPVGEEMGGQQTIPPICRRGVEVVATDCMSPIGGRGERGGRTTLPISLGGVGK